MSIVENCTVVKKDKNLIYVKLVAENKCNGCKACAFGRKNAQVLPAYSDINCNNGDNVIVEMPQKQISGAAFITYLIPLLTFLLGLIAGIPLNEGFMLLFAVIFLAIGLLAVHFIDKLFLKNKKYLPKIIEIIQTK